MIYAIYSDLPTFKNLTFRPGLNVLIAQKEAGASDRQTRNRAGKTSLTEIISFLLGADAGTESLLRTDALVKYNFGMTFDVGADKTRVERSGNAKSKINLFVADAAADKKTISNSDWNELLGEEFFKLRFPSNRDGRVPTFRSLLSYFVRRQLSGAFGVPEKQAAMQQVGDYQIALMYLLGLDWKIASDWQKVRDREKTLAELKKAASEGAFGTIIGKSAELRTELTIAEDQLTKNKERMSSFRVLPQYEQLEAEADSITRDLGTLSNEMAIDRASIRDLENAINSEAPPSLAALESIYAEAGVALPSVTLRRYDEVKSFHESVVRNRRQYLEEELLNLRQRHESNELERIRLDSRRGDIARTLKSYGALDQFLKLQAAIGRLESRVEGLRLRYTAAEQLEGTKNELDIERKRLELRLHRNFLEQQDKLKEAILAFEETSKRLYESAGSMTIEETPNGPMFKFPMQGSRSKGISNMQIFCFDMMLMRLCKNRDMGTGFLVHDSHLFDGVDGRQLISALKVGAALAEELGFQYIVTMNEDDAFKEAVDSFDLRDHVLPVVLTDAKEDGGLFGFRF